MGKCSSVCLLEKGKKKPSEKFVLAEDPSMCKNKRTPLKKDDTAKSLFERNVHHPD
jgi:hypothetical protein